VISLIPRTTDIPATLPIGVYGCLCLALAEREGCESLTADDKLVKNLQAQFPFVVPLASMPRLRKGGIDTRRHLFLTPRASFSFASRHNEPRRLSTPNTHTRSAAELVDDIALRLHEVQVPVKETRHASETATNIAARHAKKSGRRRNTMARR
jgi:hypothetical protein